MLLSSQGECRKCGIVHFRQRRAKRSEEEFRVSMESINIPAE